ncbi:hypothetical protein Nepgr_024733 [Nepenthes gracilis]|uniref:Uncharacterized protein n=1 Tax=Nepenthes gracilis TaxID=150966 RepID=A0AAD3Y0C5_NEPGR|nr:hypothetical protein Nepgr_024733 [Nepenthes gracilis]
MTCHIQSPTTSGTKVLASSNVPLSPGQASDVSDSNVVHPSERLLDAKVLEEASSAYVIHSSSGMGHVHCSTTADPESKLAEAEVGFKDTLVVDGGASHCPDDAGGTSSGMEGSVDQLSQEGQALPCVTGAEVDTSDYETSVDGDAHEDDVDNQPPRLLPDGDPLDLCEKVSSEETSSDDQSGEESSSDDQSGEESSSNCPELGESAPLEGASDVGSLPGPLDVPPDPHASGPFAVVDPDFTPKSISRIAQKYSLDGFDHAGLVSVERPMVAEALLDSENRVIDSDLDDVSSQSTEEWNDEDIANDPMYFALRCLLGGDNSRAYFKSIIKD